MLLFTFPFGSAPSELILINGNFIHSLVIVVVQLLSYIRLFVTPWISACQAPLSSVISQSLLKFMSIELVVLYNQLMLCHPLFLWLPIFLSIRVYSSELTLHIRWPKHWCFSISPSNEYSGLISFRVTGLISLLPKGLSRAFSRTTIQKHQFFGTQPFLWSNSHIQQNYQKKHSFDYMDLGR